MSTQFSILTIVLIAVIAIGGGICALIGAKKKLFRNIMTFVIIIIGMLAGAFLTPRAISFGFTYLAEFIMSTLPPDIAQTLENMPEVFSGLVLTVTFPAVFFVICSVVTMALSIPVFIIGLCVKPEGFNEAGFSKFLAPVLSAVNFVMIVAIIAFPISAYFDVIASVNDELNEYEAEYEQKEVLQISKGFSDDESREASDILAETETETVADENLTGEDVTEEMVTEPAVPLQIQLENMANDLIAQTGLPMDRFNFKSLRGMISYVDDDVILGNLYDLGGKILYEKACTIDIDGEQVHFLDEIPLIVRIALQGVDVATDGDITELTPEKKKEVEGVLEHFENSKLLPLLSSKIVSTLCEKWEKGETYLNIEKPSFGDMIDPTFDVALRVFSTTDKNTVVADITTLLDAYAVIYESGILDKLESDTNDIVSIIVGEEKGNGVLDRIESILLENERTVPLAEELHNLTLRIISTTLNKSENVEVFNEFKGSMSSALSKNIDPQDPESMAQLKTDIGSAIENANLGVEVDDNLVDAVADIILSNENFIGRNDVTEKEIEEYILSYATNVVENGADEDDPLGEIIETYTNENGEFPVERFTDENGSIDLDGVNGYLTEDASEIVSEPNTEQETNEQAADVMPDETMTE